MSINWNKRFVELSIFVSKWIKDRSVGVGVVIDDNKFGYSFKAALEMFK